MGKIGEEITQKIKSAVKAKLIELGIEVDNELPDYIMVLVANKKTQPQMEKDLQLFLGSNTFLFTTWLVNVLKKLEEVTVSKKNYKKIDVTNQEGSIVVTKKEEDVEKRQALKKVKVKVEPGTADSEANEECLIINTAKDPSIEEEATNTRSSAEKELNSSDDENSESQPKNNESPNHERNSPDQTAGAENDSNDDGGDDDASQDKSPVDHRSADEKEPDKVVSDQSDSDDDRSSHDNTVKRSSLVSLVSTQPKGVSGIKQQLDEVMEKTFNGNRRPREEDRRSYDDDGDNRDDRRRSTEDSFYSRRKLNDDRFKRGTRSPDDYDRRRRSPDNRRRTADDDRRSPLPRRRVSEFNRRSPDPRRRSPISRRRSPDNRRRSPFDRRRSPINRRRSPYNRRRSPDVRRRSPDDHRRNYDDRGRRDDKSPDDRGKARVTDAREILKRKNNRHEDSFLNKASNEDSHRSDKRRKVVSSLVHKPENPKERSLEPQIPSLVRVTPRPVRKESIQPNKKLLLLAVADAEKSVSKPYNKRPERHHSPPPSTSRSTSRKRELHKIDERKSTAESYSSSSGYVPPEKIFITLTNNQKYSNEITGGKLDKAREVLARKVYDDSDFTLEDELMYEESYFDYDQDDMGSDEVYAAEHQDEYVPLPVKENIVESAKPTLSMLLRSSEAKCIISLESSSERSCDEWEVAVNQAKHKKDMIGQFIEKADTPPQEISELYAEKSEDGFEWSRLGPAPVATVKPLAQGSEKNEKYKGEAVNKALERCKFWPSCLSEMCIYYHPSSPCKMFPLCKSGKECLFIHPDCKFGLTCLNPKCTYIHRQSDKKTKALDIIAAPIVPLAPIKPSTPLIKCVYYPNCKNLSCKFWHPVKNCKFGRTCARSDCYFSHPSLVIPPKELLTWTSKI